MRKAIYSALVSLFLVACGGGGEKEGLFPEKPECQGDAVTALAGMQPQVISKLEIGSAEDGFDLDHDGMPDNKLAAVASIAKGAIDDALANYEIVIPMEFFDLQAAAPDTCVKFAVYLGAYVKDGDGDGKDPLVAEGDCNDHDALVKPGATEDTTNFHDDDCDGLADEDASNNPKNDTADRDGDGVTIAAGDCDDNNAMVKKGAAEICGDGLDNDCDGVADRSVNGTDIACSPFSAAAEIPLDPLSFASPGVPAIAFKDGVISDQGGTLQLDAGPSVFGVNIPVTDGISLDLRISGATIRANVANVGGAIVLQGGHLGGVIDGKTADTIRGLNVDQIGLTPDKSLLDATFANVLGALLALPKADEKVQTKYDGCRTPDIDVDQDGLEAFCDSNLDDMDKSVDTCIDGNGTEFTDVRDGAGTVIMQCSEALDGAKNRFVDGISVELNFETTAVKAIKAP
jgi:hypothetical protein